MLVGYLPCYEGGNFASYSSKLDFTKMTHLNLAFGNPPKCDGVCTAKSNMDFGIKGESDADVDSFVTAAHAAGVKVLISIGGGGGDQLILQFYNAGLSDALVASLDKYVIAHKLDGVDVDIEDPSNMGAPFGVFVKTVVDKFRPRGLLITAAVAKYMQDSMPDSALHQFDFINVMNYASYAGALTQMEFYSINKKVPKNEIVLGVPFFGSNTSDTKEEDYATILAAYPNAWKVDMVGGGLMDDGQAFNYVGEDTMAKETLLGKQYGGIMIWQLLSDAPAPHSLLKVIQKNF
ncbi:glycosyl hydrolase family 18 protein [Acidicapsa ligni]|uniref:glycosyl hydrolase family 18 protein n=1 Tax=Acidicapsa ligni TaxID=542300 RepID=UPI0021DFD5C1|nr:glycosyl hydrolase family 18 protein [Acidicapsa ligni]